MGAYRWGEISDYFNGYDSLGSLGLVSNGLGVMAMYAELIAAFEKAGFHTKYMESRISGSAHVFVARHIYQDEVVGYYFKESFFMISLEDGIWVAEAEIAGLIQMANNIDAIVKSVEGFYALNDDAQDDEGKLSLRRALLKMQKSGLVPLVIDSSTISIYVTDQTNIDDTDIFVREFYPHTEQKPAFYMMKSKEQWDVETVMGGERVSFSNLENTTDYIITNRRASFSP